MQWVRSSDGKTHLTDGMNANEPALQTALNGQTPAAGVVTNEQLYALNPGYSDYLPPIVTDDPSPDGQKKALEASLTAGWSDDNIGQDYRPMTKKEYATILGSTVGGTLAGFAIGPAIGAVDALLGNVLSRTISAATTGLLDAAGSGLSAVGRLIRVAPRAPATTGEGAAAAGGTDASAGSAGQAATAAGADAMAGGVEAGAGSGTGRAAGAGTQAASGERSAAASGSTRGATPAATDGADAAGAAAKPKSGGAAQPNGTGVATQAASSEASSLAQSGVRVPSKDAIGGLFADISDELGGVAASSEVKEVQQGLMGAFEQGGTGLETTRNLMRQSAFALREAGLPRAAASAARYVERVTGDASGVAQRALQVLNQADTKGLNASQREWLAQAKQKLNVADTASADEVSSILAKLSSGGIDDNLAAGARLFNDASNTTSKIANLKALKARVPAEDTGTHARFDAAIDKMREVGRVGQATRGPDFDPSQKGASAAQQQRLTMEAKEALVGNNPLEATATKMQDFASQLKPTNAQYNDGLSGRAFESFLERYDRDRLGLRAQLLDPAGSLRRQLARQSTARCAPEGHQRAAEEDDRRPTRLGSERPRGRSLPTGRNAGREGTYALRPARQRCRQRQQHAGKGQNAARPIGLTTRRRWRAGRSLAGRRAGRRRQRPGTLSARGRLL